ncbi:Transcriptional regulatory protein YycF [Streptococcus pasteurianus]|nr:Transcriptional regulatory protein YycF [Streptococcus pasteurianus]
MARVKAHLRRTENIETAVAEENASASNSEITIGDLKILPDAFVAQKRGEDIELTHREFELLHHLATHMDASHDS